MGVVNLKGLGGEHLRMIMANQVSGRSSYYRNLPSLKGLKADEVFNPFLNHSPPLLGLSFFFAHLSFQLTTSTSPIFFVKKKKKKKIEKKVSKAPINKDILSELSAICARIEKLANGQPNLTVQLPPSEASLDEHLKVLEILVARIEVAFPCLI
jgi:hypothetical protein